MGVSGTRPRIVDLVPFDQWVPEEGREVRLRELVGFSARVVGGTIIGTAFLTPWTSHGAEFWRGLVYAIGFGTGFGLLVAIVGIVAGPERTAPTSESRLRAIYKGDPSVVADPPVDATHRLICAILQPRTLRPLGGVLYVTSRGLVFQSHILGWEETGGAAIPQFIAAELGPPRTVVLTPATLNVRGRFVRWLRKDKRPLLLCRSEHSQFILRVPDSGSAERSLQACVDRLREAAGDGRA